MKVGDLVAYRSVKTDKNPLYVARVREIWPDGIPSHPGPFVLLEGIPGARLMDHCTVVGEETCEENSGG